MNKQRILHVSAMAMIWLMAFVFESPRAHAYDQAPLEMVGSGVAIPVPLSSLGDPELPNFFLRYIVQTDTGDILLKLTQQESGQDIIAHKNLEDPQYTKIVPLGENVNTVHADFAPFRFADKIFFTSAWRENPKSPFVNRIYAAIQDGPARLIPENTTKKDAHSSHLTLSADGKRMYYTICEKMGLAGEYLCQIYSRERKYEGDWTAPKRLPRNVNLDGFNTTQPTAGIDKSLGKEVVFFASDRPGGIGGIDVWCTVQERDGTFGDPFPLPFNTPQDEVTPFFHQASQTLFFSSNRLGTLGGFDIFRTQKKENGEWTAPENLGFPLNGSHDDLYFTFHSGSKRGYFASNRPGSLCDKPSSGCKNSDIYVVEIFVELTAAAFSTTDSSQLHGVRVELVDKANGRVESFHVSPGSNKFLFPLKLEKNYRLTATLDGYSKAVADVSTTGLTHSANFERSLFLQPQAELVVRTFNAMDSSALGGTMLHLEMPAADVRVSYQNDHTSNKHLFPLKFDSEYKVSGTKPSYSASSATLSTIGTEGPGRIYMDLYLSPFNKLPLPLYFDNDQPRYVNPNDSTTSLSYEEVFRNFLKRKNDFVTGYSSGLSSTDVETAQVDIRSFFEEQVEANFAELQNLCKMLEGYLADGRWVEIVVAGNASPLASSSNYNQRLMGRRISSLENHFKKFNNGSLARYFDSGQLAIVRTQIQEKGAAAASDDRQDPRQSIFSPAASRLRNVTIIDIRAKNGEK